MNERQADAQPAFGAVERTVELGEQVEDARQHLRGDADAGVADAEDRLVALALHRQGRSARPSGVYFAALLRRLASICASRAGSAATHSGARRQGDRQLVPPFVDQRPARFDGAGHGRRHVDRFGFQLHLAAGDARHVEQVVHQPDHLFHLAVDHVARPTSRPSSSPTACRRICTALRIGASGLRSSWASMARNSFLRRSCSWMSR